MPSVDCIVIGGGPNGLAAGIELARSGRSVELYEAASTIGGGARTLELTLPGYRHDVCSAVHPLAAGSPFFDSLPLLEHGLSWVHPELPLAHPIREDMAVAVDRSLEDTVDRLGTDGEAYGRLFRPFVDQWSDLANNLLGPPHKIRGAGLMLRFGRYAIRSATALAQRQFRTEGVKALFAGLAAHSYRPLDTLASAAIGIVLGTAAHSVGWPFPRGGAQSLSDALASYFEQLGGRIVTDHPVRSVDELPSCKMLFFDVTPHQLLRIAGDRLPRRYRKRLADYRYGPAAYKVDWALHEPIPWLAEECRRAGTVHVGGTLREIASAESLVWAGSVPDRPFVLVAQPSLFDDSRTPDEGHTAWAYCHVPNGCVEDVRDSIERKIERFAPGFRDCIKARSVLSPAQLERYNENYIGGDINGGALDFRQLVARPTFGLDPHKTPAEGIYLCSSSTPPGPGVHGMCGWRAARSATA